MAFFSGNTDMDTLIDLMADQLIATGAWGTADGTLVAGAHPAKRALVHLTDTNFYVYLARQVATSNSGVQAVNEILVQLSTGFNTGTHLPSGTVQSTGIPTEGAASVANLAANNKIGTHYTWVDASGVTVLSTWASAATYDYTVLFTLERNTSKEYADGFSNFFCASIPNANYFAYPNSAGGYYYGNGASSSNYGYNRGMILRPFNFTYYTTNGNPVADLGAWESFFAAYRSPGNSKVYFEFPYFSNSQVQAQRSPIAQTNRFFLTGNGLGLSDGDLVTYVQGANTYTYIVKILQSPDSTNYSPWAIRQA